MFILRENTEFNKDIQFIFDTESYEMDSYHYRLSDANFVENFKWHVEAAVNTISELEEGMKVFVPLDMSDEYIGGLMVYRKSSEYITEYGYINDIGGYIIRTENGKMYTNIGERLFSSQASGRFNLEQLIGLMSIERR